ncbi:phosphoribosylamine--glycine ligase [Clostridium sp. B9]|uniref:phosphoribosylamine--glycine ligase n=1 Tax=Clostridium sp. B9 TaxID=3423224 RepID=UPI003D2F441C
MNILLIGSGGREHALAWKLSKSPRVSKIFVAPGNGGTARESKCENLDITDINELLEFAKNNDVELTVVGPEEPLIRGIVDTFKESGLKVFGPDKAGAMLEGSKSFSKDFMKKYGVKTADYEVFYDYEEAKIYLENCKYPRVIKADGLAAGKGVVICESKEEALDTLDLFMVDDIFNGAGKKVVVEEFLKGVEASILSITDGKVILPFLSAKDHKQIFDGNKGKNTGGMGVVSPNPYVNEEVLEDFNKNILEKTLEGIKEEGFDFKGIIFFGIMITEEGAKLLEYNVRMGDPETQSVLSLMENDLLEVIESSLEEKLSETKLTWEEGYCVNVVLASKGYPDAYEKGYEISIDESLSGEYFIAGAKVEGDSLVTSGGRVLSVIGKGKTLEEARGNAYSNIDKVNFDGMYCRSDIGTAK